MGKEEEWITVERWFAILILIERVAGKTKGCPGYASGTAFSNSQLSIIHYSSTSSQPVIMALMLEVSVWPVVVI
jgi:hypothetical protein